jgi:soluble lytic murein transglycosylase-like protein
VNLRLAAIPVILLMSAPVCADIYSYTDEQGVLHFTNVPNDARYAVFIESIKSEVAETRAGEPLHPALLARAASYDTMIDRAAYTSQVDANLLRAVIVVESGFNERARSSKGARGLMQLMPATARQYGARNAYDPTQNIHAGARYLRSLLTRYKEDMELALAAYNAGEGAVDRYGGIPPYAETRDYVPRVLRIYRKLMALS